MALLLETKTQEIIFRNLLFLKPYLGWSLVTQISQMTQIFFLCCLLVPQISQNSTDLCPMRAGISQMLQMTQIFLLCRLLVPQIPQNSTDFCPMRAGISQIMQMTQIFFASHLSPITIFRYKFDKMLIAKGFVCVTDGVKWGFIPHASITILALSLTILLML